MFERRGDIRVREFASTPLCIKTMDACLLLQPLQQLKHCAHDGEIERSLKSRHSTQFLRKCPFAIPVLEMVTEQLQFTHLRKYKSIIIIISCQDIKVSIYCSHVIEIPSSFLPSSCTKSGDPVYQIFRGAMAKLSIVFFTVYCNSAKDILHIIITKKKTAHFISFQKYSHYLIIMILLIAWHYYLQQLFSASFIVWLHGSRRFL